MNKDPLNPAKAQWLLDRFYEMLGPASRISPLRHAGGGILENRDFKVTPTSPHMLRATSEDGMWSAELTEVRPDVLEVALGGPDGYVVRFASDSAEVEVSEKPHTEPVVDKPVESGDKSAGQPSLRAIYVIANDGGVEGYSGPVVASESEDEAIRLAGLMAGMMVVFRIPVWPATDGVQWFQRKPIWAVGT